MYECFNCSFYVGYGYSCPVCGKNFSNIATIRGHYKYTHWMDLPPREEIESWRIGSVMHQEQQEQASVTTPQTVVIVQHQQQQDQHSQHHSHSQPIIVVQQVHPHHHQQPDFHMMQQQQQQQPQYIHQSQPQQQQHHVIQIQPTPQQHQQHHQSHSSSPLRMPVGIGVSQVYEFSNFLRHTKNNITCVLFRSRWVHY